MKLFRNTIVALALVLGAVVVPAVAASADSTSTTQKTDFGWGAPAPTSPPVTDGDFGWG
ncbi:hypothetical protein [Streptomyces sp. NBC_00932]|uniref:hypothetical protein n=1 Tax=Streptomyces sp. NBC_00932 TaxID=2903690 RepID=UPI00386421F8|nr:hypothetical protein OG221_27965 [Streptomyces sp. NBC_00932]